MKIVRGISLLFLIILFISMFTLCGCWASKIPSAEDLCLSEYKDLWLLEYRLEGHLIPHDEFSQEYKPSSKHPRSSYQTCYRRVFFTYDPIRISNTNIKLLGLVNEVRVYKSINKAKSGFTDMGIARFLNIEHEVYIPGAERDVSVVGDETKLWFHGERVLDEETEIMVNQLEGEIRFRKGFVISSLEVKTWGGNVDEITSFLVDLAKLSESKISEACIAV